MISSLSRIARARASIPEADTVGDAATHVATRRVGGGYLSDRAPAGEETRQQLNSFRGTTYAAVDKIARRVAQLPIRLYQCTHNTDGVESKQLNLHPFLTLFSPANGRKPHEEFSVWELMYQWSTSMDLTGEAWWFIERDKFGKPARITPLPSSRMTVVFSKETGAIAGHIFVPRGQNVTEGLFFPKFDWDYLHANPTTPFITFFRYPSPVGIEDPRGWSPVKAAAYAYDINLFESIYKSNFLKQGAQLGGILQSDVALSKDQIEEYLDQFERRHRGVAKAGLPMVLPKMLKWTTTEPTPRDTQWVETMKLTESQILQVYGISDAKLGRADIGNRNTADAMDVTFNREVIKSRLDGAESKINSDFLPIYPGQTDALYFSAKFDDPVPADTEGQMKREKQDLELNVRTRNEIRESRNLNKMGKFGDAVYTPLTHVAVDPWDSTIELAQDDKELLGFVDPAEQAKLDQAKETAKQDGKSGGAADPKAKEDGKASTKKEYEPLQQTFNFDMTVKVEGKEPQEVRTLKKTTKFRRDETGAMVEAETTEEIE